MSSDPESSITTCLAELAELYRHHWNNASDCRSLSDLAKACDEVTAWVRAVKEDFAPVEQHNQRQYEDAL